MAFRMYSAGQFGKQLRFPDQNYGEDQPFREAAVKKFKSGGMRDFDCTCLHIIHANNTAVTFPQQLAAATPSTAVSDFRNGQGST